MGWIRSFAGQMQVRVVSADLPGVLEKLRNSHILIWDVYTEDAFSVVFCIYKKDWNLVQRICNPTGEQITARPLPGLYWTLLGLLRRPVLVLGILGLLLLTLWVPGRVFFVEIEGNRSVPSNQILEQAQLCGIGFGASRREVRSEQVKNRLLEQLPQLQWAAVNTKGCVAVITVLERQQPPQPEQEHQVSSILAARDAIIREITEQYLAFGFAPLATELYLKEHFKQKKFKPVFTSLLNKKVLIRLDEQYCLHTAHYEKAKEVFGEIAAEKTVVALGEYREKLGCSRRVAVPILEHFDKTGFTKKTEEGRVLK